MTIFIIVAIIVVALAGLFYLISPKLGIEFGQDVQNPNNFIQTCVEDNLKDVVEQISMQGGSYEPEHNFTFNEIPIQYLCYTNQAAIPCVIQPAGAMLRTHVENEINEVLFGTVDNCFNELKSSYENKGYGVSIRPGEQNVQLLPRRIILNLEHGVTLSKENTDNYEEFYVMLNNNLYELIGITNSIVTRDSIFGYSDPSMYMEIYPGEFEVIHDLRSDGTTLYTIVDKDTGDSFVFATRAGVSVGGYVGEA